MSSNVVDQKTEISEKFQIQVNPKYDAYNLNPESITLLSNTANSVSYRTLEHTTNGGTSISFSPKIGSQLFMDRGVILRMDVPVTLTKATATLLSANNYLMWAQNFEHLALRRHGLVNALSHIELSLNGSVVSSVNNISEVFHMVSQYYSDQQIDDQLPASLEDRFTSYDAYAETPVAIKSLDESGNAIQLAPSINGAENVFKSSYARGYNSRKCSFRLLSPDSGANSVDSADFLTSLWCFIPFSVFGISTAEDLSLVGINEMILNITLKQNWVKELFSVRQENGADYWTNIEFATANNRSNLHKTKLAYKLYDAPAYIKSAMVDAATGGLKPYRLAMRNILNPGVKTSAAAGHAKNEVESDQISLGSIPRSVYISLKAKKDDTNPYKTPDFYGRISRIVAVVGSSETSIGGSCVDMYHLAKSNGFSSSYESILTNGHTIKLDMGKDVSCGNNIIGASLPTTVSFKVYYDNLSPDAQTYELRISLAFDTQLIYSDSQFKTSNVIVLASTVFDVSDFAAALYGAYVPEMMVVGGAFGGIFKKLGNIAKKGINYVINNPQKTVDFLKKGAKWIAGAGPGYNNITGGNIPYQNTVGGSNTMILGAGNVKSQGMFK